MIKLRDEAFRYYFYFMQERMNIFWNKLKGKNSPWSKDDILTKHKFTNVYRACDRVTQFLIKNVIYKHNLYTQEDVILRIILFKIFNKIETWEYIEKRVGDVTTKSFNQKQFSNLLTEKIKENPIFSNAYIMTGTHKKYNNKYKYKHEKWLGMVNDEILKSNLIKKIIKASSLNSVFETLLSCSFIGPFLAYQYAIDINYSEVTNFDENSFVKAGIGAKRGVKKCFLDNNGKSDEYLIQYTFDNIDKFREKYGYSFNSLYGRNPTLIDLQNCFCETDKYLRVVLPQLNQGTKRIKQKYIPIKEKISYYFPPKWKLLKGDMI